MIIQFFVRAVMVSTLLCIGQASSAESAAQKGAYLGAKTSETPAWFKESFLEFEEDVAEAAANGRRVMLFFHQDGCPYCAQMVKENFSRPDLVAKTKAHFDGISINMWGDREVVSVSGNAYTEKSFAEALKVQYTPTIIFLNEAGKLALRLDGYYPPQDFNAALDYVSKHLDEKMSFHRYRESLRDPPAGGALLAEDFFSDAPFNLDRRAARGGKPIAVYFEQPECENCELLHRRILSDAATRELATRFESVQLNIWADTPLVTPAGEKTTARDWAEQLNLAYTPSIVLFDRGGREVMRVGAFLKTFHVQSVFAYVLEQAYLREPSFQRYISARAEHLLEQGYDVDIDGYQSHH